MTVKLCEKCGRLPVHDMYYDYKLNRMVHRFRCCVCGASGRKVYDKEDAIIDWNNINSKGV